MANGAQKYENIISILKLVTDLSPLAVALIKQLTESMQGKSDEVILAEASDTFDRIKAKARTEQRLPTDPEMGM